MIVARQVVFQVTENDQRQLEEGLLNATCFAASSRQSVPLAIVDPSWRTHGSR